MAGKRFKFLHGEEIEQNVQDDPFKTATSSRRKRSPDFFDNVRQKVKEWFNRAKKFLGIGQQTDGEDGQEGREGKRSYTFLWRNTVRVGESGKQSIMVRRYEQLSWQHFYSCVYIMLRQGYTPETLRHANTFLLVAQTTADCRVCFM